MEDGVKIMPKKSEDNRKGLSIKFTVPLPDKYAPISISIWSERSKKVKENEEDMIINNGTYGIAYGFKQDSMGYTGR